MLFARHCLILIIVLALPQLVQAGLYFSGEPMAELPSQWRGFLLDQRTLRSIGTPPNAANPLNPLRDQYLRKAEELEKKAKLSADDYADLGAIYIRLGNVNAAVTTLRTAQRKFEKHFRIHANLGTAFQLAGDLPQAALALQQAVRLAPEKYRRAEEYHLKLVQSRLREEGDTTQLDLLFPVNFQNAKGEYEAGKIADAEKKKLPKDAVAIMQKLCLWFPSDARLLWLTAEIANAYGDTRYAANMMDGCVTQFGLQSRLLRQHRQILKSAVGEEPKIRIAGKEDHKQHVGGVVAKSIRPLLTRIDQASLPPIKANGLNRLPWELVAETEFDRKYRPKFPNYLEKLAGKKVSLTGFMQPFNEDPNVVSFMFLEYPIGCWYCEMPAMTNIILVEMPQGEATNYNRGLIQVQGELLLNRNDPEEFLYTIQNAKVGEVN